MVLESDSRTLQGVLLILVAALLVGAALVIGGTDWTHVHRHNAEGGEGDSVGGPFYGGENLTYENLSDDEQAVFEQAVDSDGSVWTAGSVGEYFEYPPGTAGAKRYRVEYEGETYRLTTKREDRELAAFAGVFRAGLGLAGLVVAALGVIRPLAVGRRLSGSVGNSVETVTRRVLPVTVFAVLWFTLFPLLVFGLFARITRLPELPYSPITPGLLSLLVAGASIVASTAWFTRQVSVDGSRFFNIVGLVAPILTAIVQFSVMSTVYGSGESLYFSFIITAVGMAVVFLCFTAGWRLGSPQVSSSRSQS